MVIGNRKAAMLSLTSYPSGEPVGGEIRSLTVAGYTGRNELQIKAHIDELARAGIAPPPRIPMFYSLPPGLISTDSLIEVRGNTSGEVEPVLLVLGGKKFVGVGSDHTDRDLERTDIAAAKVSCPKVLAPIVLEHDFAAERWEHLALRSWFGLDRHPYQAGRTGDLRSPAELIALMEAPLEDGAVLFMGTIPLFGAGFVSTDHFEFEMSIGDDHPVIGWAYEVERSD